MPKTATCRGIAVIRLSDRLVLAQRQHDTEPIDDASLWSDAVARCAALSDKPVDRLSYSNRANSVTFYSVVRKEQGVGAIAVMNDAVGQRMGYLCCEKTLEVFLGLFVERASKLSAASCTAFAEPIAKLLTQFNDEAVSDDRVAKVKRAADEVKDLALENVDRVIQRGEKIETMVEQTEELSENARGFHAQSTTLRRQLWWENMRTKLVLGSIVFGFLFVVYLTFCGGFTCKGKDGK